MVRRPPGLHALAGASWGRKMAWGPGFAGSGARPIRRVPIEAFGQRVTGISLTGGQAQSKVSAAGAATASIGPQGLGTVWYPAQATISTTTGAADLSTCQLFLGSAVPSNLVGQSYAGGGDTIALAVPSLSPGQLLIAKWAGGVPGDLATVNIIGTMDVLSW